MNSFALLALVGLTLILGQFAYVLCYGLNPYSFGGHLPFVLITLGPALAYALGRLAAE